MSINYHRNQTKAERRLIVRDRYLALGQAMFQDYMNAKDRNDEVSAKAIYEKIKKNMDDEQKEIVEIEEEWGDWMECAFCGKNANKNEFIFYKNKTIEHKKEFCKFISPI